MRALPLAERRWQNPLATLGSEQRFNEHVQEHRGIGREFRGGVCRRGNRFGGVDSCFGILPGIDAPRLGAAGECVRSGLDISLLLHGSRGVARLARALGAQVHSACGLSDPTWIECSLVVAVLRVARRALGVCGSARSLGRDSSHDGAVLADSCGGGAAAGSLLSLGFLRIVPDVLGLEAESGFAFLDCGCVFLSCRGVLVA